MNWNDRYEAADTPWDKGTFTPVLDEIAARHPGLFEGKVVVPGCGTGNDALWIAARGCEVTGLDIAPLAISRARDLDPTHSVNFELSDFLQPGPGDRQQFDQLFEHTCFCAIQPSQRSDYLSAASSRLKPGGKLIGVFFIDPEMDDQETGPPFGIASDELTALWLAAGFEISDSWVPTTGFDGRIGRELVLILTAPR